MIVSNEEKYQIKKKTSFNHAREPYPSYPSRYFNQSNFSFKTFNKLHNITKTVIYIWRRFRKHFQTIKLKKLRFLVILFVHNFSINGDIYEVRDILGNNHRNLYMYHRSIWDVQALFKFMIVSNEQ